MRVLFDTNVVISALFWSGLPHRLWTLARDKVVRAITSFELLEELADVLIRPSGRFRLSKSALGMVLRQVRRHCTIIHPKRRLNLIEDEPDNRVLECAVEGGVDLVITGDQALLYLGRVHGARIVRPSVAWRELSGLPVPRRGRRGR